MADANNQTQDFDAILQKNGIDACHFDEIREVFYWDEIAKIQDGKSDLPANLTLDEQRTALLQKASKAAVYEAIKNYSDKFKVSQSEATEMIHRGYIADRKIDPSQCAMPSV